MSVTVRPCFAGKYSFEHNLVGYI